MTAALKRPELSQASRKRAAKARTAMPNGSYPIRNRKELRSARILSGHSKTYSRARILAHIRRRARALGVKLSFEQLQVLDLAVQAGYIDLANADGVLDLAGKWRHGWIPLDATALLSKRHGRKGGSLSHYHGGHEPQARSGKALGKGRAGTSVTSAMQVGKGGRSKSGASAPKRSVERHTINGTEHAITTFPAMGKSGVMGERHGYTVHEKLAKPNLQGQHYVERSRGYANTEAEARAAARSKLPKVDKMSTPRDTGGMTQTDRRGLLVEGNVTIGHEHAGHLETVSGGIRAHDASGKPIGTYPDHQTALKAVQAEHGKAGDVHAQRAQKEKNLAALEVRKGKYGGWELIHTPSGKSLGGRHGSKREAETVRQEVAGIPHDLTQDEAGLKSSGALLPIGTAVVRGREREATQRAEASAVKRARMTSAVGGKVENPSRKGDLAVLSRKVADYRTGGGGSAHEEHTPIVVSHVSREGRVVGGHDAAGTFHTVDHRTEARVLSQDKIDVPAFMQHIKDTNRWTPGGEHVKAHYGSLDEAKTEAKKFAKSDIPSAPKATVTKVENPRNTFSTSADIRRTHEASIAESQKKAGRVSIRETTYRGKTGHLVIQDQVGSGPTRTNGRKVFTDRGRAHAEQVKANMQAGRDPFHGTSADTTPSTHITQREATPGTHVRVTGGYHQGKEGHVTSAVGGNVQINTDKGVITTGKAHVEPTGKAGITVKTEAPTAPKTYSKGDSVTVGFRQGKVERFQRMHGQDGAVVSFPVTEHANRYGGEGYAPHWVPLSSLKPPESKTPSAPHENISAKSEPTFNPTGRNRQPVSQMSAIDRIDHQDRIEQAHSNQQQLIKARAALRDFQAKKGTSASSYNHEKNLKREVGQAAKRVNVDIADGYAKPSELGAPTRRLTADEAFRMSKTELQAKAAKGDPVASAELARREAKRARAGSPKAEAPQVGAAAARRQALNRTAGSHTQPVVRRSTPEQPPAGMSAQEYAGIKSRLVPGGDYGKAHRTSLAHLSAVGDKKAQAEMDRRAAEKAGRPTYRERRLARAERLRGYAEKRQTAAAATFKAGEPFRSDNAFNTQPGHIPFRARLIAREDRAHESVRKAEGMASRAAEIERQAGNAIYSDDPNAVPALRERIAKLEKQREAMKARNAEYRKTHKAELAGLTAYGRDQKMPHPSYEITNLGGNLTRQRKRLAMLEKQAH